MHIPEQHTPTPPPAKGRPLCVTDEDELDARLFAHIHFDQRLTGTTLEGDTFSRTTDYILKMLRFMLKNRQKIGISNDKWSRIEKALEQGSLEFAALTELEREIKRQRKMVEGTKYLDLHSLRFSHIYPSAYKALTILNRDKTVSIPGGWVGTPGESGHAMIYKFIKEADGSYTFMVFNTGSGIVEHLKKSGIKDKYSPLMVYKIPAMADADEKIQNFIEELIAPLIKPVISEVTDNEYRYGKWYTERHYDAERIYSEVIPQVLQLGATPVDPEKYTRMTTQGQLSGTCSMRVLMPVLQVLMQGESEAFQQFLNQLRLQSIIDHFYIQKAKGNLNDKDFKKSILDAIAKEARFAERLKNRNIEGHPAISEELLDDMLKEIFPSITNELSPKKSAEDETKESKEFPLETSKTTFSLWVDKEQAPETELVQPERPKLSKQIMPDISNRKEYPSPLAFLKASFAACLHNDKLEQTETMLDELERWFFSLPADLKSASEYWGQLKPEEAKEALTCLQGIQRTYGKYCFDAGGYPLARQTIHSQMAKLTGGFIFGRFCNDPNFSRLYDMTTDRSLPRDTYGVTLDPTYDKRANELENLRQDLSNEKESIAKSAASQQQTLNGTFDLDFLEHFLDKKTLQELITLKENDYAMSGLDNARINLYHLMRNPKFLEAASDKLKKAVKDYDTYLQYQQFNQESELFFSRDKQSGLDYFWKANLEGDEQSIRMNDKTVKLNIDENPEITSIGEYKTKHTFAHENLVKYRRGKNLADFLQINRSYMQNILFSDEKESNRRLIEALANQSQEYLKKELEIDGTSEKFKLPSRVLGFTRLLNDETRLLATLDTFESNLELLEDSDCQKLLLMNLLTPNLLVERLKKDPNFSKDLFGFYEKCINYYTRESTISSGGVFCFELGHYLLKFLKNSLDHKGVSEAITLLQEKNKKLQSYLEFYAKQKTVSQTYKDLLTINLLNASLEKKVYSSEELGLLFKALIIKDLVSDQTENNLLEYEKLSCLERLKPLLQQNFVKLSQVEQEKLTKGILEELLPDIITRDSRIRLAYPIAEIDHPNRRSIKIDLSRGEMVPRIGPLPKHILEYYHKELGKKAKQATIFEEGNYKIYEFYDDEKKTTYQIKIKNNNLYNVELRMRAPNQTKWYSRGAPWDLLDRNLPRRLMFHADGWTALPPLVGYYYTDVITKQPLAKIELDPPQATVSTGPKQGLQSCKILELNAEGLETGYSFVAKKTVHLQALTQFLSRIESDDSMIEILQSKDPEKDETPYKIKLPRYNLEWLAHKTADNKLEYVWKENPDFRLILTDKEPLLGFSHCLYMENTKTKEIHCIIPKQQFYVAAEKNLDGGYKKIEHEGPFYKLNYDLPKGSVMFFDGDISVKDCQERFVREFPSVKIDGSIPLHWESFGKEQYCQYKIVKNKLEGNQTTDYLQLAYIALAKREPMEAMRALRECEKMGGLKGSIQEVDLIKKIMIGIPSKVIHSDLYKDARIDDPETDAVRLYAAWLLMEQKRISFNKPFDFKLAKDADLEKPKITDYKKYKTGNDYYAEKIKIEVAQFYERDFEIDLRKAYSNYYKRIGNMDVSLQLNSEKEALLLKALTYDKPHTLEMKNRMQELTAISLNKEMNQLNKNLQQLLSKQDKSSKVIPLETQVEIKKIEERIQKIKEELKSINTFQKRLQVYVQERIPLTPPGNLKDHIASGLIKGYKVDATRIDDLFKQGVFKPEQFIANFNTLYSLACKNDKSLKQFVYQMLNTESLHAIPRGSNKEYYYALIHLLAYVYEYPESFEDEKMASERLVELTNLCEELYKKSPKIMATRVATKTESFVRDLKEARDVKDLKDIKETIDVAAQPQSKLPSYPESFRWMPIDKVDRPKLVLALDLEEGNLLNEVNLLAEKFKKEREELIAKFKKEQDLKPDLKLDVKTAAEQDKFLVKQQKRFELDLAIGGKFNLERLEQNKIYEKYLIDPNKQNKMKTSLDVKIKQEKTELAKLEKELEEDSKAALLGKAATVQTQLQILGKTQALIAGDDVISEDIPKLSKELIWLYLQGDQELFRQKTRLDTVEANELYQKIHNYLIKFSDNQHRIRTSKLLGAIMDSADKQSAEYNGLIEQLGDQLITSRSFEANTNPEILVFECLDNKLIRSDQAKTLQRLTEKIITKDGDVAYRNDIEQKIMGSGKTMLLPLVALKKATGRNLSIVVVPRSLLENNLADIMAITKRIFGKSAYPLIFDRDTDCSAFNLQSMYEKLQEVMVNREFVITSPESIESLQLKYLELLEKDPVTEQEEKAIQALENILILIQENGDALIDECDTSLDPKDELNYTKGQMQNVSLDLFRNILKIYRILDKVELGLIPDKYTLKQVMMGQKGIPTEEQWNVALQNLANKLVEDKEGLLHAFALNLKPEQKTLLLQYILNEKITEIPDFVLNSEEKGIIGLAKGELELFRHCLKNKFNEHYGFPKSADFEGSREIAIPYASNNTPNERSQFGSVYEIINYTIEAQKQKEQLSLSLIYQFIAHYQTEAAYEVMESLGRVAIEKTKAGAEFEKLTNKKLNTIDINNEIQLKELQKTFSQNEDISDHILFKYVLPDIKQYASVQRSNGINHVEQYRSSQAVSGTTWNVRCMHQRFNYNEDEGIGVDGKTIDLLIQKKTPVKVCASNQTQDIINETVIKHPETHNVQAFIDAGALFKGKENELVASEFAEQLGKRPNNKIRHVLYFNDQNILCAMPVEQITKKSEKEQKEKPKVEPIIIGSTSLEVIYKKTGSLPHQYFTYYDQRHTTGTDIKQKPNAIGITSIDSDTKARDFWQAAMRFRDFPRGQRLETVLSASGASTKPKGASWDIKDVIHLVQSNQDNVLADLHLRSHLDKMNNIIRRNLFNRVTHCGNMALKRKLRKDFAKAFEVSLLADPFQEFKEVETPTRTEKILQKYLDLCLLNYKELLANANIAAIDEDTENIKKELLEIYNQALMYCKDTYKQRANSNEGRIVQAQKAQQKERQKEVLKQTRKEKQTERQTQSYLAKSNASPLPYLSWGMNFPTHLQKGDYSSAAGGRIHIQSLNELVASSGNVPWNFQENILVSENYANTYRDQTNKMDPYLKPLNFFLLVKEPGTGILKAMLITQEEAREFSRYIDTHKSAMLATGAEAWLMTPHNHWLNGTSPSSEINHQDYSILLEQIRFFNADLDKLSEDKEIDWLFQSTTEKLDYLENTILAIHPEKEKFLRTFNETLNNTQENLLQIVAKIDKSQLKQAIIIGDEKAFREALNQFKAALVRLRNSGICSQVLSRILPGEKSSLLGIAIQAKAPNIVEDLLKETELLPKIRFSENESPLLPALANYEPNVFRLIAGNAKVYPHQDDKPGWTKLLTEILKSKENDAVRLVLEQAQKYCNRSHFENIILNTLKELPYDDNAIKTLSLLEHFYDQPLEQRNAWYDYLEEVASRGTNYANLVTAIRRVDLPSPPADRKQRAEYFNKIQERLRKDAEYFSKIQQETTIIKLIDNLNMEYETFEKKFEEDYNRKFAIRDKLSGRTVWREFIRDMPESVIKDKKKKAELFELIIKWQHDPPNPLIAAYFQNRYSSYPPTLFYDISWKDPDLFFQLLEHPKFAINPEDHASWIRILDANVYKPEVFLKLMEIIKNNFKSASNAKDSFLHDPALKYTFSSVLKTYGSEKIELLLKGIDFKKTEYVLWGQSLLGMAIELNQWGLVQNLLDKGLKTQEPAILNDILKWAVFNNNYRLVENILLQNANVNFPVLLPSGHYTYYGSPQEIETPIIFWAISKLDKKMITLLINAGADCSQNKYQDKNALEAILTLAPQSVAEILTSLSQSGIKNLYANPSTPTVLFKWASDTDASQKINEHQLKILDWTLKTISFEALSNVNGEYYAINQKSFKDACRNKDWPRVRVLLKAWNVRDFDTLKDDLKNIDEYAINVVKNNNIETIKALFSLGYEASKNPDLLNAAIKAGKPEMLSLLFKNNPLRDKALKDAFEFRKGLVDLEETLGIEVLDENEKPIPKPQLTETEKREKELQASNLDKTIFWLIDQGGGNESLLKESIEYKFEDIVKKLTENKAFMEKISAKKEDYLRGAIKKYDVEFAIFLINRVDAFDKQAFFSAVKNPYLSPIILQTMLQKHKTQYINLRDNDGFSPLYLAIEAGNEEGVSALLTAGCDPNQKAVSLVPGVWSSSMPKQYDDSFALEDDSETAPPASIKQNSSNTPLMQAIEKQQLNIVKILVAAGASLTATNDNNETPLTLAEKLLAEKLGAISALPPISSIPSLPPPIAPLIFSMPPPLSEWTAEDIAKTPVLSSEDVAAPTSVPVFEPDDLLLLPQPPQPSSIEIPLVPVIQPPANEPIQQILDFLREELKKQSTSEKAPVIFSRQTQTASTKLPISPADKTKKEQESPPKPPSALS